MALTLWSKLEDAGDVTSPQIGTGGAEVGSPSYAAAKFGNGIVGNSGAKGCTFPTAANDIVVDKGTLEFWAKFLYASSNGPPNYKDIIYCIGTRRIRMYWYTDFNRLRVEVGTGLLLEIIGMTFAENELVHIGITWDREGNDIGGGKTAVIYINNVEKDSSVTTWTTGALPANIQVGYRDASYYAVAIIDNLKHYDVCKTDFSDKEDEDAGAPPPPSAKTMVQAALISAIPLIAIPTLGQILKYAGG